VTQKSNSIDQMPPGREARGRPGAAAAFALAKKAFLDTLAVSLSGSQLDSVRIVTALASELGQGSGPCSVIAMASRRRAGAALANGRPPMPSCSMTTRADDGASQRVVVSALLPLGDHAASAAQSCCWPTSRASRSMSCWDASSIPACTRRAGT